MSFLSPPIDPPEGIYWPENAFPPACDPTCNAGATMAGYITIWLMIPLLDTVHDWTIDGRPAVGQGARVIGQYWAFDQYGCRIRWPFHNQDFYEPVGDWQGGYFSEKTPTLVELWDFAFPHLIQQGTHAPGTIVNFGPEEAAYSRILPADFE